MNLIATKHHIQPSANHVEIIKASADQHFPDLSIFARGKGNDQVSDIDMLKKPKLFRISNLYSIN
jgi:hypothetical protein